jgi:hypothetical protein
MIKRLTPRPRGIQEQLQIGLDPILPDVLGQSFRAQTQLSPIFRTGVWCQNAILIHE